MKNAHCVRKTISLMILFFLLFFALPCSAEQMKDHPMLGNMGKGACTQLTGEVSVLVLFVDMDGFLWTEDDCQAQKGKVLSALEVLSAMAEPYGKSVSFETVDAKTKAETDPVEDYDMFLTECLANMEDAEAHNRQEEKNCFTLLCLKQEGRAGAHADTLYCLSESVLSYIDDDKMVLAHEILHLFGAKDYYFPDAYAEKARVYFPTSLMLKTREESEVDSLTAYIIGWTDEPDENAIQFLKATEDVEWEDIAFAYDDTLDSGYGIRKMEKSTYYGQLYNGLRQGYGMEIWQDGDRYTGEFYNGVIHGKGTYEWADGSRYTGDYQHGQRTGAGILCWADGTMYIGSFRDNLLHGEGICIWPDGSKYEGWFSNGLFHGEGKYTDVQGQVTEGQWEQGQLAE